uniref:Rhomboid-related protein 1 n=3 Tax=Galliformes TaxID=8976 RepID=G1NBM7_MELGA
MEADSPPRALTFAVGVRVGRAEPHQALPVGSKQLLAGAEGPKSLQAKSSPTPQPLLSSLPPNPAFPALTELSVTPRRMTGREKANLAESSATGGIPSGHRELRPPRGQRGCPSHPAISPPPHPGAARTAAGRARGSWSRRQDRVPAAGCGDGGHRLSPQISSKRSSSFKRAIANGQRALPRDGLLDETGLGFYKRFVRYVAYEILPCEMDRRWYFYQHRTCPPPVFMAAVTLTQIIVFLCYGARLNKWVLQTYHPEYMKSPLVYHPGHRARAWRFLTYMFMHVGLEQLGFNALLQLMIGVPLEMVHGILRISFLYLAGVLAGSLTVSITDMRAPLVGGSGGVYALCSAHLANVVMNWAGMRCPYKLLRMVLALVCMSSEVGRAVWLRFSPPLPASGPQPSFMAHLAGAIVGISMGLTILRSYEESLRDQCGWWVVLLSYGTFLLFAVFWNIFAYDLLGAQIPPPP